MGLADLKKNASSCKPAFKKQMSVDEFIETANLYAAGKTVEFQANEQQGSELTSNELIEATNITSIDSHPKRIEKRLMATVHPSKVAPKNQLNKQTLALLSQLEISRMVEQPTQTVKASKVNKKPFKRATFTLSELAITQLTTLSQSSKTAKSKLIRQLVDHHFSLTPAQRAEIEASLNID
ncbi:hypothetical protein EXU30_03955 [Shewanella maritima]|uniref:CopG family transcriptional regulator n=1 Tax=Shewanella maritima TaxID=2520507 RepID=A0A411PEJ1_9GAMM|nr:hypothetical protein [Shewanella maritima]QBF81945.1 hypothetical protein EXU30_03955 [Shewanella maritima]